MKLKQIAANYLIYMYNNFPNGIWYLFQIVLECGILLESYQNNILLKRKAAKYLIQKCNNMFSVSRRYM